METTTPKSSGPNFLTLSLLIGGAFVIGIMYNRLQSLEKTVAQISGGGTGTTQAAAVGANPAANAAAVNPGAADPGLQPAGTVEPVNDKDHLKGDRKAEIMMIEYSDLECPYCKQFHPTAQQVMDQYGGKVAWVYRHFPLSSIHPSAQKAAEASECVAELGGNDAFWKYLDAVFNDTGRLTEDLYANKAVTAAGVNVAKFKTCLDSGKYAQDVTNDLNSGQAAGVTGTPGTVILRVKDGKTTLIPGAYPLAQMKQAVDALLQ